MVIQSSIGVSTASMMPGGRAGVTGQAAERWRQTITCPGGGEAVDAGRPPCPGHARKGMAGTVIPRNRMSTRHRIWMATTFGGWFGKVMSCQRSIFTESPLAS